MELKEFIKSALVSIHEGISEASEKIGDGVICPRLHIDQKHPTRPQEIAICVDKTGNLRDGFAQFVKFNVCVTSETETSASGGIKGEVLKVLKFGEVSGEITHTREKYNQIRFLVPMRLFKAGSK